jgi:hypothetical protein
MASNCNWEDGVLHKTLYITKCGDGKYRINKFYQVRTPDGEAYMRPLPSGPAVVSIANLGLAFNHVQIVEEPSSNRDGARNLTHANVFETMRMEGR